MNRKMNRKLSNLIGAALLCVGAGSSGALAEVPRVAVDIAPVHALVARVMQGAGAPDLIVDTASSPHHFALRPSQAGLLAQADVIVWTSAALTPWLQKPLAQLGGDALHIEAMQIAGTRQHGFRGDHEHDHDHGHEDDHDDHDDHDEHDHDEHDHDEHDAAHQQGEESTANLDPHGWLDPENAQLWMQEIARDLGQIDPENAALYTRNAEQGSAELAVLTAEIAEQLKALPPHPYVALHDGFQYFDRHFDLTFAGAIALGDASAPSPARIAEARRRVFETGATCIFTEPQQNPRLAQVVAEGLDVSLGELDALGAKLVPGPELYPQLLRALAQSFVDCLSE